MLGSIIYSDIILCFKAEAKNALTAATELDGIWNASVSMHESMVVVKFWPEKETYKENSPKSIKKGLNKAKEILNKYNVPYKTKKYTF